VARLSRRVAFWESKRLKKFDCWRPAHSRTSAAEPNAFMRRMKTADHTTPQIWAEGDPPRLIASQHKRTLVMRFPPFSAGSPLTAEHELVPLAREGVVYSCTVVHRGPKSFSLPFYVGYVDLPGPVRVFGRIRGSGVSIGAACVPVVDEEAGYAFEVTRQGPAR
jgi:uncharacterized protein